MKRRMAIVLWIVVMLGTTSVGLNMSAFAPACPRTCGFLPFGLDLRDIRSVSVGPQSYLHQNATDTVLAFEIAKSLHFNAIKLWFDPADYNYTRYDLAYLESIFTAADGLELALFISTIPNLEHDEAIGNFPWNETENAIYASWVSWMVAAGNGHPSVAAYNFYCLPFERSTVDVTLARELKSVYLNLASIVHTGDQDAGFTLFADPLWTYIPLKRDQYDALGFQPYSWEKNSIQRERILNLYRGATTFHECVFVDEVGLRSFDTTGRPNMAICSDELIKYQLILEYRRLFEQELCIGWSYFMLFDRANGVENDFGIVEYNGSCRPSSAAFLTAL